MAKSLIILYFVPYVPNLIRVRPYNFIRNLSKKGHCVTLVTLASSDQDWQDIVNIRPFCQNVIAIKLPRWRSLINCAINLPMAKPLQAVYCWQPEMMKIIVRLLNTQSFDLAHIEHLRGAEYGINIKDMGRNGIIHPIPVIWDSVDCISLLFSQATRHSKRFSNRFLSQFELARTRGYEGAAIHRFEHTVVTSDMDKDAFLQLIPSNAPAPISVIPNGVDLDYFNQGDPAARQKNTLVISGKMSYHANVSMVLNFVEKTMPLVWRDRPDITLWVAGKDPPSEVKVLNRDPRIIITGTVSDLRPYLQNATVAVAPLMYGVGIQNKVLEAMACGTPVVCSPKAISALSVVDGQDVLTAEQPEELAKSLLHLLSNEDLQHSIGSAGRSYVENSHRWNLLTDHLVNIYRQSTDKNLAVI